MSTCVVTHDPVVSQHPVHAAQPPPLLLPASSPPLDEALPVPESSPPLDEPFDEPLPLEPLDDE